MHRFQYLLNPHRYYNAMVMFTLLSSACLFNPGATFGYIPGLLFGAAATASATFAALAYSTLQPEAHKAVRRALTMGGIGFLLAFTHALNILPLPWSLWLTMALKSWSLLMLVLLLRAIASGILRIFEDDRLIRVQRPTPPQPQIFGM